MEKAGKLHHLKFTCYITDRYIIFEIYSCIGILNALEAGIQCIKHSQVRDKIDMIKYYALLLASLNR